jgi:hypothetical protein
MEPGTGHDHVAPGQTQPRRQPDQESGQRPSSERSAGTGVDQDGGLPDTEDGEEIVPL